MQPDNEITNVPAKQEVDDELWKSVEFAATEDFFAELAADEPAPETAPPAMPVPGEGNWSVDPDTGEVVEIPKVLVKLGWTEFPHLPAAPVEPILPPAATIVQIKEYEKQKAIYESEKSEWERQLERFAKQVDQVTDRIAGHQEAIARYDAQAAAIRKDEVGPKEKAITFWTQFVEPLVKQLGPFRLPTFKSGAKKGQFSKKTMVLPHGSWRFTKSGGLSLFDFIEFRKHRTKQFLEQIAVKDADGIEWISLKGILEAVDAGRLLLQLDYQKASSEVKKGLHKDAPGTKSEPENQFAKVKLVLEKSKGGGEEEDDE